MGKVILAVVGVDFTATFLVKFRETITYGNTSLASSALNIEPIGENPHDNLLCY
jgi:hypothetical protein